MTTKQDVINTRHSLATAIDAQIEIFRTAINQLENAKRAVVVVTGATQEPVPLREEDVPAVKGFVKNLAERMTA